ncbi:minor virion structural protein [Staphylococcus phage vB_StaM_SA1]|nr:minor virion structural protein [Staphylococcus phage vB_StaM_SA1]
MANKVNLFTDVISLLQDIKPNSIRKNYKDNNKRKRSMKSRSGDFILQFPLVTSDTIEQDTVELMRNQLELERAFEFDFVLTNSPLQTFDPKDPTSFMADLHNNVNLAESTKEDIKRSNNYLLETPEEKFNMSSLNNMTITREEMKELVNEGFKISNNENTRKYEFDFDEKDFIKSRQENSSTTYDLKLKLTIREEAKKDRDGNEIEKEKIETEEYEFKGLKESDPSKNVKNLLNGEPHKDAKGKVLFISDDTVLDSFLDRVESYVSRSKNEVDEKFGAKVVIDKDKINSSLPTTISSKVTFMGTDSKGEYLPGVLVPKEVKFGVKTVVHVVKTEDIIFYLSDKSRGSNLVTKLVKFTTGELRLVKDLLLDADKVKKIAQDSKKGRSGAIWNKLNSLYTVNKASGIAKSAKANYIPTTALMITIDEANEVKRKTGVDLLSDRRAVKKIYNEFFLLDFIIIDQTRELVYKYLPDHNKFEVIKESKLGAYKVKNNQKDLTSEMLEKLLKR